VGVYPVQANTHYPGNETTEQTMRTMRHGITFRSSVGRNTGGVRVSPGMARGNMGSDGVSGDAELKLRLPEC